MPLKAAERKRQLPNPRGVQHRELFGGHTLPVG